MSIPFATNCPLTTMKFANLANLVAMLLHMPHLNIDQIAYRRLATFIFFRDILCQHKLLPVIRHVVQKLVDMIA